MTRYTLPYREKTADHVLEANVRAIHPPIQGGNPNPRSQLPGESDTPSHTGRKHPLSSVRKSLPRYTLPYREETEATGEELGKAAIHPPIQGGNNLSSRPALHNLDTPSHTGRKPGSGRRNGRKPRYTLPYREETLSVYAGFSPPNTSLCKLHK